MNNQLLDVKKAVEPDSDGYSGERSIIDQRDSAKSIELLQKKADAYVTKQSILNFDTSEVAQLWRSRIVSSFDYGRYEETDRFAWERLKYLVGQAELVLEQLRQVNEAESIHSKVYHWSTELRLMWKQAATWVQSNPPRHAEDIPDVPQDLLDDLSDKVVGYQRELNDSFRKNREWLESNQKMLDERYAVEDDGLPSFTSLKGDDGLGLYTLVTSVSASIRQDSGETGFEDYSDGVTVAEAVQEAITGLDLTGSISFKYSRHDFQPSGSQNFNLQIQLGGSKNYRVGKGDTSSTLVVISKAVWQKLEVEPGRLKAVLQAAHFESFKTSSKVELL